MKKFNTYTGKNINLLFPEANEICIEDIAIPLARQCRFRGHCNRFYSNAQHSLLLTALIEPDKPDLRLAALLHDAAESYLGDSITLTKKQEYYKLAGPYESVLTSKRDHEYTVSCTILEALIPNSDVLRVAKYNIFNPDSEIHELHKKAMELELRNLMNTGNTAEDNIEKVINNLPVKFVLDQYLKERPITEVANTFIRAFHSTLEEATIKAEGKNHIGSN